MKLREFGYLEPRSIHEALELLREHGETAQVLAGGTDVLPALKHGGVTPKYLVNIKKIAPPLSYIQWDEEEQAIRIGALTPLHAIETSPLVRERFPILAHAAHSVGSYQVRNRATIGGNICRAAPSADNAPGLIALGAKAKIVGPLGERTVPLEEFFLGPGKTVLKPDELLVEFKVEASSALPHALYVKHSLRRAMDLAIVGVATALRFEDDSDVIADARIVLGAVAPRPIRAREAENLLRFQKLDSRLIAEAGEVASNEASPIDDVRSSAFYRREMIRVVTRRALRETMAGASRS